MHQKETDELLEKQLSRLFNNIEFYMDQFMQKTGRNISNITVNAPAVEGENYTLEITFDGDIDECGA